jgi:predicted N-acetyltransferase YhbS
MRSSKVFVATEDATIVATLGLASKKPWAIDTSYFTKCEKALYLLAMAVAPARQRQGIGHKCLHEAKRIASAWPADAIRLDAYNADAGGGPFYQRCGYIERGRVSYRNTPLIYHELLLTKRIPSRYAPAARFIHVAIDASCRLRLTNVRIMRQQANRT